MPKIEVGRGNLTPDAHKRYNDAPFSTSTTSNWVAKHGGLPPYVRAVARGIRRNGHSLSEAIQMAIGVMSNWIASPHTKPETKAKATAALAWWEKMKAAAHADGRSDAELIEMLTRFMDELEQRDVGEWSSAGPPAASSAGMDPSGAANLLPVGPSKKQSEAITHRFKGADLTKCAECGKPILDPVHSRHKPGQPIAPVPREATLLREGGHVPPHAGAYFPHLFDDVRRPKPRHKPSDPQNCKDGGHPATKSLIWAEGAAYIPVCDAHEAKYVAKIGGESEVNERIPIKKADDVPWADDDPNVDETGAPVYSPHGGPGEIGDRHAGPDHLHVSSGHLAGHVAKARAQNERHMASVEGPLTDALRAHFADQRRITINRLLSKNTGKRLMKHAVALLRAEGDEPIPPDSPYVIPPDPTTGAPASVNPAMIFLPSYWADKTAQVIAPHLNTATVLAAGSVDKQLGHSEEGSLGPLQDLVAQRAHAAAQYITGVTAKDLSEALQQGVAHGEGMAAIASRVNDVFDKADIARAKQIAQTEVVGAYNEGATQYAQSLPEGVVGSKRWISHHDQRTRLTHRLADGQEQPLDQPYWVGGAAMMHPGDKSAPIGEWIGCRCNQVFLPPGLAHSSIADAAAAYVAGLKAKPVPA